MTSQTRETSSSQSFLSAFRRARLGWSLIIAFGCSPTNGPKPPPLPAQKLQPKPIASAAETWRTTAPPPGADSPWFYPAPNVAKLSNQLSVHVLKRPSGPVSLSLVIRHGASDLAPEQSGLASLAAQMIVEATKSKNHHVLSETVEALGSTLTGDANRDFVRLSLDTLPSDFESGISLLAETLLTPAFNRDDFRRLQQQHLDDLVSERQNPSRLASLVGMRALLGDRLGAPVGGRLASVRKLTVDDVRLWHRRFVYPTSVALVVVGPVEPTAVQAAAERHLGHLRGNAPQKIPTLTTPAPSATEIVLVDRPGSVQSAIFVAQRYPKRSEQGYAARQVLDNVIGGQFTSRINRNLREEHAYTYGARSAAIATRDFGLLTITTSVETDVTVASIQEIIKELRDLQGTNARRPSSPEELTRARTGILQSLGSHLEDSHRLLLDQEQIFVHQLSDNYYLDYINEVRNVDAAALASQAERLTPDQLTIVIIGDATRLKSQLDKQAVKPRFIPLEWLV